LKPNSFYKKYIGEIIWVDSVKTNGKILINIPVASKNKQLKVDDILFTNISLKKINKALNPNIFDYKAYLQKQGIYHQIRLKSDNFKKLSSKKKTFRGIAFQWREKINSSLNKNNFSKEELSIINALLLGQRNDISSEIYEDYKNAGAIHILAVSGLHIGIILLFLNFLFQPLERFKHGKIIKLIIVVICLWMYAFIAGLSASVVRAVTMFTAIAIGMLSNRPSGIKNNLVISLFFLLMIHPLFLFDVGFQLSYTAVFSIVWLQPHFKKLWQPKIKIVGYFWQLLSISFAAQIGLLPLSLYYFHQFPGLFFISSLVIIPFLGFILGFGIIIIILSLIGILPSFLANFYGLVIQYMNDFIAIIAQQKSFIFKDIPFSFLLLLVAYLILISCLLWLHKKSFRNLAFLFSAIIFVQITMIYEKLQIEKTNEFIVFHQVKNTLIANRQGHNGVVYQKEDMLNASGNNILKSYALKFKNLDLKTNLTQSNVLQIDSKKILIIDSKGIYKDLLFVPEVVILTQSPKINLERLIHQMHPRIIIADGSNYKNYVNLWKTTCENENTYFFNTSVQGAFQYPY
ncbi:ComEC/Rec2 family competence protein, partial [Flavobacteriaceae bacterium AH-315-O20]|nr:ComEC/Rec2 family competence protein [Flavobacteriaceae bacterium AH-315-O20]MBN4048390.1 ComEC/Rec2 family competence protein [Flavobacteriaceae bacterium AH-315-O20]